MENISNLFVSAVLESQVVDELLNSSILLLVRARQLQAGGELERLAYRKAREQDIFLLDICCISGKRMAVDGNLVIEEDVS